MSNYVTVSHLLAAANTDMVKGWIKEREGERKRERERWKMKEERCMSINLYFSPLDSLFSHSLPPLLSFL